MTQCFLSFLRRQGIQAIFPFFSGSRFSTGWRFFDFSDKKMTQFFATLLWNQGLADHFMTQFLCVMTFILSLFFEFVFHCHSRGGLNPGTLPFFSGSRFSTGWRDCVDNFMTRFIQGRGLVFFLSQVLQQQQIEEVSILFLRFYEWGTVGKFW